MLRGIAVVVAALAIAACGSKSSGAKSADDAASPTSSGEAKASGDLEAGTSVCISELTGVRYHLEDALREHGLEPVADCMFADVTLEEGGEAGAFFLRFQRSGESEWKRCESSENDRIAFLTQCAAEISASPSGGDG